MELLSKCILCESNDIQEIDKKVHLFSCNKCFHIFHNPRPSVDEIKKYYSRLTKYDSWLKNEKLREKLWQKRLSIIKRDIKSGNLLDVGTGIGQFLQVAKKDFSVTGTEISTSAVNIALRKYKDIKIVEGELETIEFKNTRFDIITLFHILEHVPYPLSTIKRCQDLLRSGGIIIIAIPNELHSLRTMVKELLANLKIGRFRYLGKHGLMRITLYESQGEVHLSHFDISGLLRILEDNGFIIIRNTLDPYYIKSGIIKALHNIYFFSCLLIKKVTRINIYDTAWITARVK